MAPGSSVLIWTDVENKKFELALEEAMKSFDFDTPDDWNCVATEVGGGKSVEDIKEQFAKLKRDVKKIDDGRNPVPNYKPLSAMMSENDYVKKIDDGRNPVPNYKPLSAMMSENDYKQKQ